MLIGIRTGDCQMDVQKDLIRLINFSKTLIQDAEITFLWYEKYPRHPDDVGAFQQKALAFREQELKEVHKDPNPEELRKAILKNIENVKRFGGFQDSDDKFFFKEVNLVFQVYPETTPRENRIDYRMEFIDRFENYPSLSFRRYFNGGTLEFLFARNREGLEGRLPNQFANDRRIGRVSKDDPELKSWKTGFPCRLPPNFIDASEAHVEAATLNGKDVYIITHYPFEKVMSKVYVRIRDTFIVLRKELYYQSPSPNANEDGYWLRTLTEYSDFEIIKGLNLAYPKIMIEKEFQGNDGFLRRITTIMVKEMAFNQGLPTNFFDWNLQEYHNNSEE